ncbi:hypothetical protein GCM10027277_53920 [Pseudoduganella ginsengisoli]
MPFSFQFSNCINLCQFCIVTRPPPRKLADGYIRIRAASMEATQAFLDGNPVYEGGGTVEVRELPSE